MNDPLKIKYKTNYKNNKNVLKNIFWNILQYSFNFLLLNCFKQESSVTYLRKKKTYRHTQSIKTEDINEGIDFFQKYEFLH